MTFNKITIAFSLCLYYVSGFAYLSEHLARFEQTRNCKNCDLTQMSLSTNQFSGANLSGSFLVGMRQFDLIMNQSNCMKTNWIYSSIERGEFNHSNFTDAKFNYVLMTQASFEYSNFTNVVFENARLVHNNFANANFKNANFKNADLSYSNLLNSNITEDQLKQMSSYQCAILPDGTLFDDEGKYSCEPTL